MEKVGMNAPNPSQEFWSGKRVLVTGHTGFKGSWLAFWLKSMGADVCGFAKSPENYPAVFDVLNVARGLRNEIGDIRDYERINAVVASFQPEIVLHLAAQPLVRRSYSDPIETYSTNVMGLLNLFESVRCVNSVKCVVNVTSDKCYENKEWTWGYRENEPLGGYDPYSSSKACVEIISEAYKRSYFTNVGVAIATARAGNVIGGGDWSPDRLIPDALRSFQRNEPVQVRNPNSVRPWQHVVEPLLGYLMLAERLYEHGDMYASAWNFGPNDQDARKVSWVVDTLARKWGHDATWKIDDGQHPHEANYLKLDVSKARQYLNWTPRWSLETAIDMVVDWHRNHIKGADMIQFTHAQISSYLAAAKQ